MNIMKTNLVKENGKYYVTPFGTKILVDGKKGQMLAEKGMGNRELTLGVRPEHIVLAKSAENAIPCTLEVNEMMGSELHLHVYTEDGTRIVVRVPTLGLTAEERTSMVYGKKLYITFEGEVMHFFDNETNQNLLFGE